MPGSNVDLIYVPPMSGGQVGVGQPAQVQQVSGGGQASAQPVPQGQQAPGQPGQAAAGLMRNAYFMVRDARLFSFDSRL